MDRIFEAIEEWMRNLLTGMVSSNLTTMYTDVNEKTGQIAAQVGQTPQGWNGSIYSMIQNLSESVIVPIAGMIITFVLCYELISMLTEKNNMHDIDTWMFFKYFFKMWVAVWIVSHTFTITMAVFDVGQSVVSRAAGVISSDTAINIDTMISTMETAMESMEIALKRGADGSIQCGDLEGKGDFQRRKSSQKRICPLPGNFRSDGRFPG